MSKGIKNIIVTSPKQTYLITRMYAGSYLDNNLGGEAINLLLDDNGNNYVFVGKLGYIDSAYDNTVKGIIMTRLVNDGCFEIVGAAKIDKDGQIMYKSDLKKDIKEKITRYSEKHNIRYGGVKLRDIYPGDYYGADLSFKSKKLMIPKEPLYLTDKRFDETTNEDSLIYNLKDKTFGKTPLLMYITDQEHPLAFAEIERLINDSLLWINGNSKIEKGKIKDNHFNFLEVIHKDYDELAYSNLFAYIFNTYPELFIKFANKVLSIDISNDYSVYREKDNIDLWIEDDKHVLIIENKIKSGINGVSERHDFTIGGNVHSQLKKYYDIGEKYTKKVHKDASYFIFVPNYNKIDLRKFLDGTKYKVVRYSTIYNFYNSIKINDVYYNEFVNALYKHTKDREVDYAEDMAYRLLKRIKKHDLH